MIFRNRTRRFQIVHQVFNCQPQALCIGLATFVLSGQVTAQVPIPVQAPTISTQNQLPDSGLRAWRIQPLFNVTETYSDNVTLAPSGAAKRDWITTLSPGLHAEGTGARVRGFFDYRMNSSIYANDPQLNNRQNALNSRLTVELIESNFFVETRASISQQLRSAFAPAPTDTPSANSNRVETSVYQVSPYWRGRLPDIATYQIRFNATQGSSRGLASASTSTSEWLGSIRSATPSAKIAWAVDGSSLAVNNGSVETSHMTRARGSVIMEVQPEMHISLFQGSEVTDFAGLGRQSTLTPGYGFAWVPSNRTQVVAIREKRIFGQAHTILATHRTPRLAFRYDDTQQITVMPNLIAASGPATLNALMSDLLAASVPDRDLRAKAVNARLESSGQPASGSPLAGLATNQVFLSHSREASVALLGAINTITFSWNSREQRAVGAAPGSPGDFSVSPNIYQQSLRGTWMHRVSALSSMTLIGSRMNARSLSGATAESTQTTVNLVGTRQIGPRAFFSLGIRRSKFDSTVAGDNQEHAVISTLAMRF